MKHIWKILKFTSGLRWYYVAVSVFSVVLAVMGLITPLLSGRAIDELRLGTGASVSKLVWLAVWIFALDVGSTLVSNIGGYLGDRVSTKLQRILSTKYYEHI